VVGTGGNVVPADEATAPSSRLPWFRKPPRGSGLPLLRRLLQERAVRLRQVADSRRGIHHGVDELPPLVDGEEIEVQALQQLRHPLIEARALVGVAQVEAVDFLEHLGGVADVGLLDLVVEGPGLRRCPAPARAPPAC